MPVLANLESELLVTEGDGPTLIDSDVSVADAEQNWELGLLAVTGKAPGDIISLLDGGQITLDVFDVSYGGQVIGDWSIGPDGEFLVRFNANATNAGVEAVIESLQIQSTGDDPANHRNLRLWLFDGAGELASDGVALFPRIGASDPFHSVNFGSAAHVALGDIDNDGDLDAIVSVYDDGFHLLRNVGTENAPDFQNDDANLSIVGAVNNAAGVTLYDYDGDGFLDLIVGKYDGTMQLFLGDAAETFTEQTGGDNPFAGIDVYGGASPGFADLNGDGFVDILIARGGGRFDYFTGDAGGGFAQTGAANPLDGFQSYGGSGSVSFADIDGDDDLDFISGNGEGSAHVFENTGTASAPVFVRLSDSEYIGQFGLGFQPVFADIDNDGDLDVVVAHGDGVVDLFLLEPATPSIDINVDGVDDAATVTNETPSGAADGPIVVNLLSNDSDVDNPLGIAAAEIDGQPLVIDDITTLADGTRITILSDGSVTIDPGKTAQRLGAAGSGASNTSLQYVLTYTLLGGETGTATFTVSGVDDKDILQGTAGDDVIHAGVGNDTAHGLDGMDMLYGDDGNDSLFGGDATDVLTSGDGADKAYGEAGADYLYGGAGADYLYGGDANDTLRGEADNDYLDGGVGADTMFGGAGNDVYIVDTVSDRVHEVADAGYDIIRSTVSIAVLVDDVEAVQLQGTADLNADGNGGANNLQGNAGANILSGGAGGDTINGNDGNDVISGGASNDLLRGGLGADTFIIFQESLGNAALETDQVYDFSAAEGDIVNLLYIDANTRLEGDQSFRLVGAFSKYDAAHPELTGQLTLTFSGGITTLRLDVNGDARVDYQMKINGDVTGESGDWLL